MQNQLLKDVSPDLPRWLSNFIDVYQRLSTSNLALLKTIYHEDVTFIDPIHKLSGFDNLADYFKHLYTNLTFCEFVIDSYIIENNDAAIYWQMSYRHKHLNKGDIVNVSGTSRLKGKDGKVIFHQDYVDLGAMFYEQIPVFGSLTKWFKNKAGN